jgi:hypothetical protein
MFSFTPVGAVLSAVSSSFSALPKSIKLLIAGGLIIAVASGYIGWLTYQRSEAEKVAEAAQTEANRQAQAAEGMRVLQNTANIAQEVENDKRKANQQEVNSNLSNGVHANSVNRDSGTFSGNYTAANARFCRNFPNDSRCKKP